MITRLLLGAAIVALLAAAFTFRASARMPDFEVYRRAGLRAAAAEPLYRPEDEHYQLKYLPAFAILAIPAALVPVQTAKAIWFAVSAGLIGVLLALSLRLLPERRKRPWVLALLTFLAMAKFYGHELVLGQVNILLAVLILGAVHSDLRGRSLTAGALVALAVVVKPYAVIFLPWLLSRRSPATPYATAGLVIAVLSPAVLYGWEGTVSLHQAWWRTVSDSTAPNLLNADNVSLAAMYAKWFGPGALAAGLATASGAVLLAGAALVVLRRRGVPSPAGLEAGLLLALIPLLSPQGWDYVFLVATPAVMYVINYEARLPRAVRMAALAALAAVGLSLYDILGRQLYSAFMAWSIVTVCFLALIAALVALRWRRVA